MPDATFACPDLTTFARLDELRDRLATADGPHEMLTLLEEELT